MYIHICIRGISDSLDMLLSSLWTRWRYFNYADTSSRRNISEYIQQIFSCDSTTARAHTSTIGASFCVRYHYIQTYTRTILPMCVASLLHAFSIEPFPATSIKDTGCYWRNNYNAYGKSADFCHTVCQMLVIIIMIILLIIIILITIIIHIPKLSLVKLCICK